MGRGKDYKDAEAIEMFKENLVNWVVTRFYIFKCAFN